MMGHLDGLSAAELRTLAGAFRSGRLELPPTALALQRFTPGAQTERLLSMLRQFHEFGGTAPALAFTLELLAEERARDVRRQDSVDLVWSGPETPVAPSRDTGAVVRELFKNARHSVLVAGYAIYQGKEVFRELAERMDALPELKVEMYLNIQREYRDSTIDASLVKRFVSKFKSQDWPGQRLPVVFYDPRALEQDHRNRACLHAKCVVVDKEIAFASSANFTQAAQERNIEVGIRIDSPSLAHRLVLHFESLRDEGLFQKVPL